MSLTGNVLEFRPGDKVIQIFPVARPFVGVVVGANKVEGKVYVSWNGRTMQVDPEDIQIACGSNFYGISRQASAESKKIVKKIASALSKSGKPNSSIKFHRDFENSLVAEGLSREEADDIAHEYQDAFQKRANINLINPIPPLCGEPVVILNDGGSKPGFVGILVDSDQKNAVVDLSHGWSPVASGCRLMNVPLNAITPVYNSTREAAEKNDIPNIKANTALTPEEEVRVANRAFDLFMGSVKNIQVFDNDEFKAWVQTECTPEGDIAVSAVVERDSCIDPLINKYPLFSQKVKFIPIQNKTDYQNMIEKINPLVDDCTSSIMQYFRNEIVPSYIEDQLKDSLGKDK